MALGFERMQVATGGLVYSFGFDFIEPNVTMPPFGGTPVESTYEILLFKGPALVGQVRFEGADIPNDVQTFLGVWSDQPFDRIVINDVTGDDDDEFFGEFYTGVKPAGCTVKVDLSYGRHVHDERGARDGDSTDVERMARVWGKRAGAAAVDPASRRDADAELSDRVPLAVARQGRPAHNHGHCERGHRVLGLQDCLDGPIARRCDQWRPAPA